jgi:hypothetical protein
MLSSQDKANIYTTIYSSNMKQLSRKYNKCKNTCALPIQCTFNINPIYFYIIGNYQQSSNKIYNTILTITENITIYLFVTLKVFVQIASKDDPNIIIGELTIIQPPGVYNSNAGSDNLIIKSQFNVPNC